VALLGLQRKLPAESSDPARAGRGAERRRTMVAHSPCPAPSTIGAQFPPRGQRGSAGRGRARLSQAALPDEPDVDEDAGVSGPDDTLAMSMPAREYSSVILSWLFRFSDIPLFLSFELP
jgi:hypothetical protein